VKVGETTALGSGHEVRRGLVIMLAVDLQEAVDAIIRHMTEETLLNEGLKEVLEGGH
jgi:phosphoribosylformylglycinamidine (FGAM) synthase PurS component